VYGIYKIGAEGTMALYCTVKIPFAITVNKYAYANKSGRSHIYRFFIAAGEAGSHGDVLFGSPKAREPWGRFV
jgi:hypothetical protein